MSFDTVCWGTGMVSGLLKIIKLGFKPNFGLKPGLTLKFKQKINSLTASCVTGTASCSINPIKFFLGDLPKPGLTLEKQAS